MLITDENLGILFVHLGLLTEEQKSFLLREKIKTRTDLNIYQLAIKFGYIRKGCLDAAMEKIKTDPWNLRN